MTIYLSTCTLNICSSFKYDMTHTVIYVPRCTYSIMVIEIGSDFIQRLDTTVRARAVIFHRSSFHDNRLAQLEEHQTIVGGQGF